MNVRRNVMFPASGSAFSVIWWLEPLPSLNVVVFEFLVQFSLPMCEVEQLLKRRSSTLEYK